MQVTDIVKDWLKSHGYDGLYTDECGCRIEDLAPCGGEGMSECCAGVYKPCDPATGYDFWIGPKESTAEKGYIAFTLERQIYEAIRGQCISDASAERAAALAAELAVEKLKSTNSVKPQCCEDCGTDTDLVVKCESCFEYYRR